MKATGTLVSPAKFDLIKYYDDNQNFIAKRAQKIGFLNNKGEISLGKSLMYLPRKFPENFAQCNKRLVQLEKDCELLDCSLARAEIIINNRLKLKDFGKDEIKLVQQKNKLYWTYQNSKIIEKTEDKSCLKLKLLTYFFSVKKQRFVRKKKTFQLECTE